MVFALYHVGKILARAAQVFQLAYPGLDTFIDELAKPDKKAADKAIPAGRTLGWESDPRLRRDMQAAVMHLRSVADQPGDVYRPRRKLAEAVRDLQRDGPTVNIQGRDWVDADLVRSELERVDAAAGKALDAVNESEVADRYRALTPGGPLWSRDRVRRLCLRIRLRCGPEMVP
ncbi:MAG: hypothetical protein M3083_17970 [Actinomycetota bacterium]|nr:hypothetical protein [Actinomycetota bacterium]